MKIGSYFQWKDENGEHKGRIINFDEQTAAVMRFAESRTFKGGSSHEVSNPIEFVAVSDLTVTD
jgi:hypothetical protein